jgi:hypothetical protein
MLPRRAFGLTYHLLDQPNTAGGEDGGHHAYHRDADLADAGGGAGDEHDLPPEVLLPARPHERPREQPRRDADRDVDQDHQRGDGVHHHAVQQQVQLHGPRPCLRPPTDRRDGATSATILGLTAPSCVGCLSLSPFIFFH